MAISAALETIIQAVFRAADGWGVVTTAEPGMDPTELRTLTATLDNARVVTVIVPAAQNNRLIGEAFEAGRDAINIYGRDIDVTVTQIGPRQYAVAVAD